MVVKSQSSPHVERARSAVQELLLLNHPVDCPICDQAGECRLQDYWLEHQRAKKRMRDEPVHKPKAVVFGPTIVYDAERCIVCTRCIRFCEEVAKDPVLSVRERGNLNEIVVSPGRQLDHAYTLMTEYVCPVGALTAVDFRFKARVWFLRSARSICVGCATGCNAFTDYDPRDERGLPLPSAREPRRQQVLDVRRGHARLPPRQGGARGPGARLQAAGDATSRAREGLRALRLGSRGDDGRRAFGRAFARGQLRGLRARARRAQDRERLLGGAPLGSGRPGAQGFRQETRTVRACGGSPRRPNRSRSSCSRSRLAASRTSWRSARKRPRPHRCSRASRTSSRCRRTRARCRTTPRCCCPRRAWPRRTVPSSTRTG